MSLSSMSPQSKMGAAGGGVAVLGSASYLLYRVGPPQYVYYLTIGIILVGLLMGVFYWLAQKVRRRKARPMERGLRDNLATMPQGVSEPARRARLDDIRKNFEDGVEKPESFESIFSVSVYILHLTLDLFVEKVEDVLVFGDIQGEPGEPFHVCAGDGLIWAFVVVFHEFAP